MNDAFTLQRKGNIFEFVFDLTTKQKRNCKNKKNIRRLKECMAITQLELHFYIKEKTYNRILVREEKRKGKKNGNKNSIFKIFQKLY